MATTIAIINGHPDPIKGHLSAALAEAYGAGAAEAGHEVRRIDVADLDFPLLRTATDFETGTPVAAIAEAQETIREADHLLIVYPLWLGTMPALLKGFLEQVFRPTFAFTRDTGRWPASLLKGRSARIVVTMGMPAFVYRWYFGAHSLKSLERNILKFVGIGPIRTTLFGMTGAADDQKRQAWLEKMRALGRRGV